MAQPSQITIGSKNYDLPEMNFAAIERAWPFIEEATLMLDPIRGTAAGLRIIAACLLEDENFEEARFGIRPEAELTMDEKFEAVTLFFKKQLKARELEQVRDAIIAVLKNADLIRDVEQGEAEAGQEASPSMETAPATSPNSSPQAVREAVGTE